MIAASSEFTDKPDGEALRAFATLQDMPGSALPTAPDAVPLDVVLGQEIARQVAARGVTSRLPDAAHSIDAAIVAREPEEVGGRGSGLRRCIVTGEIHPHERMIRFVLGPEHVVTPDLHESLPGRGYWVLARRNELMRAIVQNAFSRAAQQTAVVPPALIDQVVVLARRACLSTLGLARRAWEVDLGHDFVKQALQAQRAGLVLIARNAPSEVQHKLDHLLAAVPVVDLFNTAELSVALGRESLVFVGIRQGQWSLRLQVECQRLAQLLGS